MSTFVTLQPPENSQHLKEINLELAGYGVENYDFDFRKKYNKKTIHIQNNRDIKKGRILNFS